ncbi:4-galactosyl-N-acetylglucosaminide 3-alpha-L-fucosyltransferase FUT6-like [Lytechinus variegatus]|uniref:4-galactosyl-N-acetylglucosaminide 3-alpha-L-fucosyltransferase FUT6-like n=1 Tax=Lytechinus variegatus TaxID=7654 RepID=UPI001BB201D2|nr:4-galactosyl-N-acetylglucosaminide 3-alpha-L-fucosyltransferase FUT6-like [Lytechinus variegatus]
MHRYKPKGQKWIFYSHESPIHTDKGIVPPHKFYNNSYDLIMSYRVRESHIYGGFGRYYTDYPEIKERRNWAENKTELVAWMASNCDCLSWDRNGFVKALSSFIPVSTYGICGLEPCPKDERCMQTIGKHKFYLALENTACRDYITEKVWRNALLNHVVPVVFGAPREDYERILPPNSFIHVEDFKSVKELAAYLLNVSKNDTLYNTYFEWKKFGWVKLSTEMYLLEPEQICHHIVSRLLNDERDVMEGKYHQPLFPDWTDWWTNSCKTDFTWPIKFH